MSFKIEFGQPIGKRLLEIICYQVNKIIMEINQKERDVDDIIHDMRRRFKKIRSILKLIRENIDEDVYDRENQAFREMARLFDQIRDAEVLLETFVAFQNPCFEPISSFLQNHYRQISHKVLDQHQALDLVCEKLQGALQRFDDLALKDQGWEMIVAGIKRTYTNGQEMFKQACGLPSMTRLHEWRKQVRCLGFQLKLVRFHHPDLQALFKDYSRLGSLLGSHHDLSMLEQMVLKNPSTISVHSLHLFLDLLEDSRSLVENEAVFLGHKLYNWSANDFEKKISRRSRER